ncbi:hypothetical protein [Cryobacterium sp. HLT2-28]|uniref:hypothetical protein n=1 Tax=Cryobacterium sp. HLT2-28 TaxID=1259146 RepID=UPI00106B613E|nr:hypothetical protein [Cryobacterium sp. HLT2-28]TFB98762.1 hypothetical protein E3O48_00840 [Cryobacterium sp. HLT2-28]
MDTLFRGRLDEFLHALDGALAEPWGDITLTRSTVSVIETTSRRVKPRRFQIVLSLKGATWRRTHVEVAFPEGDIAARAAEATDLGLPPRMWPPHIVSNPPLTRDLTSHWKRGRATSESALYLCAEAQPGHMEGVSDRLNLAAGSPMDNRFFVYSTSSLPLKGNQPAP